MCGLLSCGHVDMPVDVFVRFELEVMCFSYELEVMCCGYVIVAFAFIMCL